MTRRSRGRPNRGHNLMEMLIATVIFATVMISFASVYQYIAISTAKTRSRIVGQYLAKALIEKCVAAKYYNVDNLQSDVWGGTKHYDPIEMTFRKDGEAITHEFLQEVDIVPVIDPVFNAVVHGKLIRVRVSWREKNRVTAATMPYAEYRTYIGENS